MKIKALSGFGIVAAIFAAVFLLYVTNAFAALGLGYSPQLSDTRRVTNFTLLSATTTNATSTDDSSQTRGLVIAGAKRVEMLFSRGGATSANTGLTRFSVQVSPDGTNWYNFSRLIGTDASGTATSTVSISAATSTTITALDLRTDSFFAVRCIAVEITDGEHTCAAYVEY